MSEWSVVSIYGKKSSASAQDQAMGSGQGSNKGNASREMHRISCGLTREQAEAIASYLNKWFLNIDYATAERIP